METTQTPWTIWYEAVTALDAAELALDIAYRASHPSRQHVERATEARNAALVRKEEARLIVNAAMDAADRAEESAAVAEVMRMLGGK